MVDARGGATQLLVSLRCPSDMPRNLFLKSQTPRILLCTVLSSSWCGLFRSPVVCLCDLLDS